MTASSATWRRPGRGRPRNEDRAEILVHFAKELENGRSISEIAANGLVIMGYELSPDGQTQVECVLRRYRGATLERRYREFLQEVERATSLGTGAMIVRDDGITGPWKEQRPLSFPRPKAVRRGRPKEKRAS